MKKFTKYFGGVYMKYWYVAAMVVAVLMVLSLLNDKNFHGYKLVIYNNAGDQVSEYDIKSSDVVSEIEAVKEIKAGEYFTGGDAISNQLVRLPITKKFIPQKTF